MRGVAQQRDARANVGGGVAVAEGEGGGGVRLEGGGEGGDLVGGFGEGEGGGVDGGAPVEFGGLVGGEGGEVVDVGGWEAEGRVDHCEEVGGGEGFEGRGVGGCGGPY